MVKDRFFKVILVIISVLLLLNIFNGGIPSFITSEAAAVSPQKLSYRGNGVGIACSNDGRYVYAVGSGRILRSTDYGSAGSWEMVVED